MVGDTNGQSKTTILGILGVLLIAAALVGGIAAGDDLDSTTTPLITTVLGFMGISVMALVSSLSNRDRTEKTALDVRHTAADAAAVVKTKAEEVERKIDSLTNGELQSAISGAIEHSETSTTVPALVDLGLKVETIQSALSTLIAANLQTDVATLKEKEKDNGQSS